MIWAMWPRTGWRRAVSYVVHRVRRLPGTPHSIAAGVACGAAISFTPLMGFHFLLSALFAWLIGGNVFASAVGTALGNPWTLPLIWVSTYQLGNIMLFADPDAIPEALTIAYMFDHPGAVLLPMTLGSIPFGAAAWLICYWLVRRLVVRYQLMRRHRHERRLKRILAARHAVENVAAANEQDSAKA